MQFEKLFQKGVIGTAVIKNRIVMPAMGVSLADPTGEANDDIIAYYEERAKGGVGLIITEICRIDETYGVGTPNQLSATDGRHVPHLQRMVDAVHKYNCKMLLQLHHPGRENHSDIIGGRQIVAPSAVMCKVTNEMPRALTTEECEGIMRAFVKGAVIAQKAGMDGVELHAAHGYLLNQFLSPYTNKRTDKYGGSFANRMRIMSEIITAIRHLCGPKFIISVRISADEFVEGGLKIEDTIKIARTLESYGIDVINVSCGIYESSTTIIEPMSYPQGWKKHLSTAIRENVKIPVIAVNNIKDPEVAEALLDEGVCDYVGIGRGLLADPNFANKARTGKEKEIRRCIGCLHCFATLSNGCHIACAVNPVTGREREYATFSKNGADKPVAIIGGGIAGMQAALVLKERGFKPVIFEREETLGGLMNVGDKPLLKEKITAFNQSLIAQVESANIDVRTKTEATVEMVKELAPEGVFVACGGKPIMPVLPGADRDNVMTAEDVLTGKKQPKGFVAVIGAGMTGLETAELLASKGHKVAVVEMTKNIGAGLYRSMLYDFMTRFKKYEPQIMPMHKLVAVTDDGAVLVNMANLSNIVLPVDSVVLALGIKPDHSQADVFEAAFDNVNIIGDANEAGKIADAMADSFGKAFVF